MGRGGHQGEGPLEKEVSLREGANGFCGRGGGNIGLHRRSVGAPAVEVVGNLGKRGRIQESPVSQQSRVGKVQSLALTRQSALVHDLADQGVTEPVAV